MERIIHIRSAPGDLPPDRGLYITSGRSACSYAVLNRQNNEMAEYAYYRCNGGQEWTDAFTRDQPGLFQTGQSVKIVFETPDFILYPSSHYQFEQASIHLDLVYGPCPESAVFAESVDHLDIVNIYRIDQELIDSIRRKIPSAEFSHLVSLCLKKKTVDREELLFVEFSPGEIMIQLWIKQKLHLFRFFPYETSEDVLYILVRICRVFDIPREAVCLRLSGLIDKDSAIYRELYHYFLDLSFDSGDPLVKLSGDFNGYPAHYFSSIRNLAACEL